MQIDHCVCAEPALIPAAVRKRLGVALHRLARTELGKHYCAKPRDKVVLDQFAVALVRPWRDAGLHVRQPALDEKCRDRGKRIVTALSDNMAWVRDAVTGKPIGEPPLPKRCIPPPLAVCLVCLQQPQGRPLKIQKWDPL
jgi:hypothetical protein